MPEDDPDGTMQTGTAKLPPAKRPSPGEAAAMSDETPELSDEELDARQRRLGTKRKPAGPPLEGPQGAAVVDDTPADVPPTDVVTPAESDAESPPGDDSRRGNSGPLESSEE